MKNLRIFRLKLFFPLNLFVKNGKKRLEPFNLVLSIMNLKIIPEELLSYLNLLRAQVFCSHNLTKDFKIDEN